MKRVIIQFVFILFVSGFVAQSQSIDHLFNTYGGEKDVVSLYIPGFLCRIGAALGDLDEPERELLNSIRSVRILVSDNDELNRHVNFVREINYRGHRSDYSCLLEVHDSGNDVVIMGKERNGQVSELLIVVGGDDNAVICIKGRMDKDLLDALYEVTGVDECRYTKEI
jgi:Domain of unknown function (DUF4252)